jgi:hypothetical protein
LTEFGDHGGGASLLGRMMSFAQRCWLEGARELRRGRSKWSKAQKPPHEPLRARKIAVVVMTMVGTNLAEQREPSAWVRAHEALSRLAKARAMADAEEGRWMLAAVRSGAHVHLGYGSFGEYIERLFGYGRRCTQEKLRVAEALEKLPETARALERGALSCRRCGS